MNANVTADFRFNYFDNCLEECCLLGTQCDTPCQNVNNVTFVNERKLDMVGHDWPSDMKSYIEPRKSSLPLGVESSVWTEMNVSLLGVPKRIIQIETRFTSVPHYLSSFSCPLTSSLLSCVPSDPIGVGDGNWSDWINVEEGIAIYGSLSANSHRKYVYRVRGDDCETGVKVRLLFVFRR